ncbi:MAG TPA: ABC transporter permease [Bryobacteraceae bacterium]|jgi:putative ABC transport system permease protein|nr:ABC transporter permease [Bryobacteraceae bacterium]
MLNSLIQDLRYALRSLRSTPAFALTAILSLALGIGANTAIFSLIDSVMLKTLPVNHPEQLLQVRTPAGFDDLFTNPLWEQIRDRQDVFSTLFAYSRTRYNLAAGGEVRNIEGARVSGQYFESLGIHAVLGRTLTAEDDKRGCAGTAVLSHDFWQRAYAGRTDVVGQTISLNGHPFEIVGVTEPGFSGIEVGSAVDVSAPICTEAILDPATNSLDKRGDWWLRIIGRPKPGTSAAQVTARLNTLAPEIFKATLPPNLLHADQQAKYLAGTFNTAPASGGVSGVRSQYRLALLTLMVVVGVVLLIACANVANLLLARGAARQREIAIRMALGSGRARLIRQLLTESLLLSFGGAALGVVFAQWGTRLLVGLLSTSRSSVFLNLSIDGRMLAFTAGVATLTGLLFGLAPAWRGTRVQPQTAMKANSRGVIEGAGFGLAKTLVMLQVALSVVLVVGAGLMLGTFWKLSSLDTGFDRQNVLLVRLDKAKPIAYQEILDRVRAIPGVLSASMSGQVPIGRGSWNEELDIEGYGNASVMYNSVTAGYFETLRTPLVMGRDFNQYDTPQSQSVAIVNETFARRYYGFANPLRKRFRWRPGSKLSAPVEIVGIVKDAKYASLREKPSPTMFIPETQVGPRGFANIEIRANTDVVPSVKAEIEAVNRDINLQFATFTTQIEESLVRERLLATLSGFFGGLALLLATIGLYGVMSYNVARRRNEIGIRMALGAEQARVLRMVLGEVGILVFSGLAVGIAAALATTRFLQSFLYGLAPNDPWVLGSAAAVLASVALLAGYLPARRASRLDPMTALREE